jgi:hypothetical protein
MTTFHSDVSDKFFVSPFGLGKTSCVMGISARYTATTLTVAQLTDGDHYFLLAMLPKGYVLTGFQLKVADMGAATTLTGELGLVTIAADGAVTDVDDDCYVTATSVAADLNQFAGGSAAGVGALARTSDSWIALKVSAGTVTAVIATATIDFNGTAARAGSAT